jgi:predicted metal-dependent phosphoesterase TrpH
MHLDLHIHTTAYSSCSTMSPDELMLAAIAEDLDGVCITEHNRIWSREEAEELSQRYGLAVFRGMEVTTTGGDILVFGMEEEPLGGLWSPAVLKQKVDAAGGIAIAAHPFRGFLLFGFGTMQTDLKQSLDNPTFSHVHGLEVCNGMVTENESTLARQAAEALGLIKVGGSDAHKAASVGTCVTCFEDTLRDEEDLIRAILSGRFVVERMK